MAVGLAELYRIGVTESDHEDLLQRMAAAITESSLAIVENGAETAPRKAWAYNALTNPIGTAQTMLSAALIKANDADLLDSLPIVVTDTAIRNVIDDLVDVYAEIQAGA